VHVRVERRREWRIRKRKRMEKNRKEKGEEEV
jgi:hypothetical protein